MQKQTTCTDKQIIIQDELSKIQIDQLHKATLNFSNQCFETKKLCVVALTSVVTVFFGLNKKEEFGDYCCELAVFLIAVTFLFFVVDSTLCFYQSSLRTRMIEEENQIYKRNKIKDLRTPLKKINWMKAALNKSNLFYLLILIVCISSVKWVWILEGIKCQLTHF